MTAKLRRRPAIELIFELEEIPTIRLVAGSLEDERRVLEWAGAPAVQARLRAVLADALDATREWADA